MPTTRVSNSPARNCQSPVQLVSAMLSTIGMYRSSWARWSMVDPLALTSTYIAGSTGSSARQGIRDW